MEVCIKLCRKQPSRTPLFLRENEKIKTEKRSVNDKHSFNSITSFWNSLSLLRDVINPNMAKNHNDKTQQYHYTECLLYFPLLITASWNNLRHTLYFIISRCDFLFTEWFIPGTSWISSSTWTDQGLRKNSIKIAFSWSFQNNEAICNGGTGSEHTLNTVCSGRCERAPTHSH